MPHPDDPAGQLASEDSGVSGGTALGRRERNRLSSVQARKKAKVDRHQIELNLARFQIENRTLRLLSTGAEQWPVFDQFLVDDLLDASVFSSSKSRTSSTRKSIIQMLTNASLLGHGVQNCLEMHCKAMEDVCAAAAAVADPDEATYCDDARRELESAREQFCQHGEALRLVLEQMRSALKEDQQAQIVMWAHEHADLVYGTLMKADDASVGTIASQSEPRC